MELRFTVNGKVVGKGRPRVTRYGTYTPKKTKDYEELIKYTFLQKYGQIEPIKSPIGIELDFYMYIPKNTSQVRRKKKNNQEILPTKQPDFDNMTKSVVDALNGIAYKDDNQIVEAKIRKLFSDTERAEIRIWTIDKEGV